jgi:hypothetical protein
VIRRVHAELARPIRHGRAIFELLMNSLTPAAGIRRTFCGAHLV